MSGAQSIRLGRDLTNVSRARRWLIEQLDQIADLTPDQVAEAGVVISELVTNVFRHTESDAEISVATIGRAVRVGVRDADQGLPVLRPMDPTRTGGNGIRILDAFSTTWGCDLQADEGKEVWFTITW